MEKVYRPATWFRIFCWVLAVICTVLVVLFPGAILMVWLALKAHVIVRDDHLEVRWFRTRIIPWSSISAFQWARAAGAVGAAMRPLSYQLEGTGKWGNIPVGAFENNQELLQTLRDRTRLALP